VRKRETRESRSRSGAGLGAGAPGQALQGAFFGRCIRRALFPKVRWLAYSQRLPTGDAFHPRKTAIPTIGLSPFPRGHSGIQPPPAGTGSWSSGRRAVENKPSAASAFVAIKVGLPCRIESLLTVTDRRKAYAPWRGRLVEPPPVCCACYNLQTVNQGGRNGRA
jgi:hypothetical protein